ncbi:hypothetical protein Tco_1283894 [Tanacetum coccineum]
MKMRLVLWRDKEGFGVADSFVLRCMDACDSEIDRKIEESVKEVVTASVQHAMRAPLHARFKDLPTSDTKEIMLQRMLEENYDNGHEDHKMAFEALQKSIIRDERASGPIGTSDSSQDPPPSQLSSTTNQGDQSHSFVAPGSSKTVASTAYIAWTTTSSRLEPAASSVPEDVLMHEESDFEAQDMRSDDEDSGSSHIPKVSLNQEWIKPLSEEERPATPEPADKYGMQMIMRLTKSPSSVMGLYSKLRSLRLRGKEFKVKEEAKSQENLSELGKLYWWTNTRRRL